MQYAELGRIEPRDTSSSNRAETEIGWSDGQFGKRAPDIQKGSVRPERTRRKQNRAQVAPEHALPIRKN